MGVNFSTIVKEKAFDLTLLMPRGHLNKLCLYLFYLELDKDSHTI